MAELILVKGRMGLTNQNHDHYTRNINMNIQGDDLNELLLARMGKTDKVNPQALQKVALRTSGMSAKTHGVAYIEESWAVSRGLAFLEFDISNGGIVSNKLGVYGYCYGGSPIIPGQPIPDDIMFVPVRSWLIEQTAVPNEFGMLSPKTTLRQSGQLLLNDPSTIQGSFSIRPYDIVSNTSAIACMDMDNQMGGDTGVGHTTMAGTANAILSTQGMAITNSDNNAPNRYGEKLLSAAMTSSFNSQNGFDPYDATSSSLYGPKLAETDLSSHVLLLTMVKHLGQTITGGFQGWTLGQLAQVFPTFGEPGVIDTRLTNTRDVTIDDNRLTTDTHNNATYASLTCDDLMNTAISVLADKRLATLRLRGSNNVMEGQIKINDLPVSYQLSDAMPSMTGDEDWMFNAEDAAQQICWAIYSRFNSAYVHERQIMEFDAFFQVFGETTIMVRFNADDGSTVTRTFGTFAGNRIDPSLTTMQGMQEQTYGFYERLKNELNF